jgi:hypothetical protein
MNPLRKVFDILETLQDGMKFFLSSNLMKENAFFL